MTATVSVTVSVTVFFEGLGDRIGDGIGDGIDYVVADGDGINDGIGDGDGIADGIGDGDGAMTLLVVRRSTLESAFLRDRAMAPATATASSDRREAAARFISLSALRLLGGLGGRAYRSERYKKATSSGWQRAKLRYTCRSQQYYVRQLVQYTLPSSPC